MAYFIIFISCLFILVDTTLSTNETSATVSIRSENGKAVHKLYFKVQTNAQQGQSFPVKANFVYISGLNQAFHVTRNTLFRITFEGGLYNAGVAWILGMIQVLVNDHVIIGNRVLPNTLERDAQGFISGAAPYYSDLLGGYYQVNSAVGILTPLSRTAHIYLSPGVYSFNIGARSISNTAYVHWSVATYEVIQFEDSSETALGQFPLVTNLAK